MELSTHEQELNKGVDESFQKEAYKREDKWDQVRKLRNSNI